MDKSIKKVEKMCITYCKNMCINCENNCSILSKIYFGVQKAIIPPTFPKIFTSFSTKNLICLLPIFSTIPHSLNTITIIFNNIFNNYYRKEA